MDKKLKYQSHEFESPFADFVEVFKNRDTNFQLVTEIELNAPFVTTMFPVKYKAESENKIPESLENVNIRDNPMSADSYVGEYPPMEEELSTSQLQSAVSLNEKYKKDYQWEGYEESIITQIFGVEPAKALEIKNSPEKFAQAFADWQIKNGFTTSYKGVLGINNWTYFQKKLGFHNLSNKHGINVEKSIKDNKHYRNDWEEYLPEIYKHFQNEGVVVRGLPLNDEYFAYAIADLQAKENSKYPTAPKKLLVDGILGYYTRTALFPHLIKFPNVYSQVIAGKKLDELADEYLLYWNALQIEVKAVSEKIYEDILIKPKESHDWEDTGTVFAVVASFSVALAPATGGISLLIGAIAALASAAPAIGSKIDANKNADAQRDADIRNKGLLAYLEQFKGVPLSVSKTILTIAFKASIERGEKNEIIKLIQNLKFLYEHPKELKKNLLLFVFKNYKPVCKLIVYYKNEAEISTWTHNDIENVKKKIAVRIEFVKANPYSAVAVKELEAKFSSEDESVLKKLWNLWRIYYTLSEFTVVPNFYVVFRTLIYGHPYDAMVTKLTPRKENDKYVWGDIVSINSGSGNESILFFYSLYPTSTRNYNGINEYGQAYKDIILTLSNHAISSMFNVLLKENEVVYVEKEISSEDQTTREYFINDVNFPVVGRQRYVTDPSFLLPATNIAATRFNQSQLQKSNLAVAEIYTAVNAVLDSSVIRQKLLAYNQINPNAQYSIDGAGGTVVDSVFTECIHQFQIANYLNPADQDGVIGESTLDTLGLIRHGLKRRPPSNDYYGQHILNQNDIKRQISVLTNGEFTSVNWYEYILKPSWLGVKITDGIHALLYRKLREAEEWLLFQPQYRGMTPAALGRTLGFTAQTRYSGARLSSAKQAMHGFGLALDINVAGNPWIGAGWVKNDQALLQERYRMIKTLRVASGNESLPGSTVFEYLHSIAQETGNDTHAAYNTLKKRSNEFINHLRNGSSELAYWRSSQSFANRNPLNGFLNLHADLVYALRQIAGLAWGAIDFGPRASGDIMHFDLRTTGIGKVLCEKLGGYIPTSRHPTLGRETVERELEYDLHEDHNSPSIDELRSKEFEGNNGWEGSVMEEEQIRSYDSANTVSAFLTLAGARQGQIKGSVRHRGQEGSIAVHQIHHAIISPRDSASGQATGKRIYKPLVITKEVDMASVKLLNAFVTNETLVEVVINFWQNASSGSASVLNYYRIKLKNASISNILQEFPASFHTPPTNSTILERIEFTFQSIEWSWLTGAPGGASDRWESMPASETIEYFQAQRLPLNDSKNSKNPLSSETAFTDKSTLETSDNLLERGFFEESAEDDVHEHYSDEMELVTEKDYFTSSFDNFITDISKAILLNRQYATSLGWNQYQDQINELLLPYSGQQNVSLSEDAFALALALWQKQQGFSDSNSDGILGPNTWQRMQPMLLGAAPPAGGNAPVTPTTDPAEREWANSRNIQSRYPTVQAYKAVRDRVVTWGLQNPAPYIDEAITDWNANRTIHHHFDNNFDGDPHRSYLNLKRLYQARGIVNPAKYFSDNIVNVVFFNKATPGHKDLQRALTKAQSDFTSAGNSITLASAWSFVPRTFNADINKLSNHALGKAIDINPNDNPHVRSRYEIQVINAACRTLLPHGLLAESNPDALRQASALFQRTFNEQWLTTQPQAIREAAREARTELNRYAAKGFLNLPTVFVRAMQNAGLRWGGSWTSAKDFMHFEVV